MQKADVNETLTVWIAVRSSFKGCEGVFPEKNTFIERK
jgi:hypothetical protein